jgi:transcriptional regulator with XRE-family HTH domain
MKLNYSDKTTKLKMLLLQRGYTQNDLAALTGIQRYQISQMCSGKKTNIYLDTAKRIALALDVTLDEAFGD